jgi:hypothetical protein
MDKDTGGPAFPTRNYKAVVPVATGYAEGMTLRDYFAAKAMQGLMDAAMPMPEIAAAAYAMADDMLKARGKT